jgi:hypothetical protein
MPWEQTNHDVSRNPIERMLARAVQSTPGQSEEFVNSRPTVEGTGATITEQTPYERAIEAVVVVDALA